MKSPTPLEEKVGSEGPQQLWHSLVTLKRGQNSYRECQEGEGAAGGDSKHTGIRLDLLSPPKSGVLGSSTSPPISPLERLHIPSTWVRRNGTMLSPGTCM